MDNTFVLYNRSTKILIGFFDKNELIEKLKELNQDSNEKLFSSIDDCVVYINDQQDEITLHVLKYLKRDDIETIIENLGFEPDDNLIFYVVSNYNGVESQTDDLWDTIVEDLVYQYTSDYPEKYKQKSKKSVVDEFFLNGFDDVLLINELERRGYFTGLLYSESDINLILEEDFDGQELSKEDKESIIKSLDSDNFTQDINDTISRMIEDDYKDKLY